MKYGNDQTLLPSGQEYNNKTGANGQRPKPVKFRQHRDGTASVRVNGHWFHGQTLDRSLYLSLPGSIRRRVMRWAVKSEFRDGHARISGSSILVEGRKK
jgi:hypothetical protein